MTSLIFSGYGNIAPVTTPGINVNCFTPVPKKLDHFTNKNVFLYLENGLAFWYSRLKMFVGEFRSSFLHFVRPYRNTLHFVSHRGCRSNFCHPRVDRLGKPEARHETGYG